MQNQLYNPLDLLNSLSTPDHLSDDGFYLIAIVTMLKQIMKPELLQDYLISCSLLNEKQAA
jgi:hypothetical protein